MGNTLNWPMKYTQRILEYSLEISMRMTLLINSTRKLARMMMNSKCGSMTAPLKSKHGNRAWKINMEMKNGLKWWKTRKTSSNSPNSPSNNPPTSPLNAARSLPRKKVMMRREPRKRVSQSKKENYNVMKGRKVTLEQACTDFLLLHWPPSFLSPCGEERSQMSIAVFQ